MLVISSFNFSSPSHVLFPGKELVHGGPLLGLAALDAVHALEDALDLGHDGRELSLDPVHLVAQAV